MVPAIFHILFRWEQGQKRSRVCETKETKRNVRNMFRPNKSNKLYDSYDIEEKDNDKSRDHNLREPADVYVAREELVNITQQQEEIEFRKKDVMMKLEQEKRSNTNLEERVLREASNEHHRDVIKMLCFLHEYQIRNVELESVALMKEYLLQQKDLETQRGDMRRRIVDENCNVTKGFDNR